MKKIGILTYHHNINRGSILQAYCLWKSLNENITNSRIEIIDYRILSKEIHNVFDIRPNKFIKKLNDQNTWKDFFRNHQSLSSNRIITNNYKKAINFLKKQDYDMIVVGSDQIWRIEKGKTLIHTNRPFPNAYFLDPSLNCIKVSYAASANRMDYNSLSKSEIKLLKECLSTFDRISVRDAHTEKILNKMGINNIIQVPDPTFLVDIPTVDLEGLLKSNGIDLDRPILGIDRINEKLSIKIIEIYRNKGYQIVTPTYFGKLNVDVELSILKPFEYYSIFKYFDMVVTESFHSTIFCIKNLVPFVSIDSIPTGSGDKMYCLLNDLSLLDRYIYEPKNNINNILEIIENMDKPLDKIALEQKLQMLKTMGIRYIKELESILYENI